MRSIVLLSTLFLAGCAIEPYSVLLEQDHLSSASQHLMRTPCDYGVNATMVYLHWAPSSHTYVDLGEGVSYSASVVPNHPETFSGRFGVQIELPR